MNDKLKATTKLLEIKKEKASLRLLEEFLKLYSYTSNNLPAVVVGCCRSGRWSRRRWT